MLLEKKFKTKDMYFKTYWEWILQINKYIHLELHKKLFKVAHNFKT